MVLRNKSQFTVEELHMRTMRTNSDTDAPVSFVTREQQHKVPSPHNGASTTFLQRGGVTDVHVKIVWVCVLVLLLYETFMVVFYFKM